MCNILQFDVFIKRQVVRQLSSLVQEQP